MWEVCQFPTMFLDANWILSSPFFSFYNRRVTSHLCGQHFWTCWHLCHSALPSAMSGEQTEMATVSSHLVACSIFSWNFVTKVSGSKSHSLHEHTFWSDWQRRNFVAQQPFLSGWTQFLLLPCRSFFSHWTERKKEVEMWSAFPIFY